MVRLIGLAAVISFLWIGSCFAGVYLEALEADDFNKRFTDLYDLASEIICEDIIVPYYFTDGQVYRQDEVNINFDYLIDKLEVYRRRNCNRGYIYKRDE